MLPHKYIAEIRGVVQGLQRCLFSASILRISELQYIYNNYSDIHTTWSKYLFFNLVTLPYFVLVSYSTVFS